MGRMDIALPVVPEGYTVRIHRGRRSENIPNGIVWSIDKVGQSVFSRAIDSYFGRRRFVTEVWSDQAQFEADMQEAADAYFEKLRVASLARTIREGR